jgi:NAD(P)-dependent dehydrogenase (short-subunit alcohol dehydrogenase family)
LIGRKIAERLALARAISPADAAGAVLYLATARNVTGQMIPVDAAASISPGERPMSCRKTG